MSCQEHLIEQLKIEVEQLNVQIKRKDKLLYLIRDRLYRLKRAVKTLEEEEAPLGIVFRPKREEKTPWKH